MTRTISLLAAGGTIAARTERDRAHPGRGAASLADEAQIPPGTDLRVRDVSRISSRNVTVRDMWDLAMAVRSEIERGTDGVVITHGTDTLEETAYALALLVDTTVPVVITGAMRTSAMPGSDGPANLSSAISAAAYAPLADYGPVVVHQDEIHAARWVTKFYSTRVGAFASPACGPVGIVSEGRPCLLLSAPPGTDRLATAAEPVKTVGLIWVYAGADDTLVPPPDRLDGLVVAGTGGGHVPAVMAAALLALVEAGRPVVLSTRCVGGQVLHETYGGHGSETHLLGGGLLSAGPLPPLKARLRLLFGLSADLPAGELFLRGERTA
jgi:L-asparaginase